MNYDTIVEALNDLQKRGYKYNFNLKGDCIYCQETGTSLNPDEFEIVEFYRFEGDSNPSDNAIVYAIESNKHNLKGVLIDAYGVYSDPMSYEIISKLKIIREKLGTVVHD